jgi:hypothetical protein
VDVELSVEESTAVQNALRTYHSDLRMEIVDTDNPAYRRGLREERELLDSVLGKLDEAAARADAAEATSDDAARARSGEQPGFVVIRLVSRWPI